MEEAKVLRIALESLQEQLSMLQKTRERLTEQNRQKDERIEELTQTLLNMQRARFGERSKKSVYVLDDGTRQLSIFDPPQGESANTAAENRGTQVAEPSLTEVNTGADPGEDTGEIVVSGHKRRKKRTLEELCAKEFLKGFHGILVTDGYNGYNKVPEVTRAGCWRKGRDGKFTICHPWSGQWPDWSFQIDI